MAKKIDTAGMWEIKDNPITHDGVFQYSGRMIDGSGSLGLDPYKLYNVYRPFEELEKACASFNGKPLINDHTMLGNAGEGLVKTDEMNVGGTIYNVKVDPTRKGYIVADMTLFSDEIQNLIRDGKKELSLGYFCKYRPEKGDWNGIEYDFVQYDLEGNHIALVDLGRMGHDCRVFDKKETIDHQKVFVYDNMEITMSKTTKDKKSFDADDLRKMIAAKLKDATDEELTKIQDLFGEDDEVESKDDECDNCDEDDKSKKCKDADESEDDEEPIDEEVNEILKEIKDGAESEDEDDAEDEDGEDDESEDDDEESKDEDDTEDEDGEDDESEDEDEESTDADETEDEESEDEDGEDDDELSVDELVKKIEDACESKDDDAEDDESEDEESEDDEESKDEDGEDDDTEDEDSEDDEESKDCESKDASESEDEDSEDDEESKDEDGEDDDTEDDDDAEDDESEDEESEDDDETEDDEEESKDEDDKKSASKDAKEFVRKTLKKAVRKAYDCAYKAAYKNALRDYGRRERLYTAVEPLTGSFAHDSMTVKQVAKYAAKRLHIKTVDGAEVAIVKAHIAGMRKNEKMSQKACDASETVKKPSKALMNYLGN